MWRNEHRASLSARQLGALALTAAGVPVFRLCCRVGWLWALLGGLGAAALLSVLTALSNRRRAAGRPLPRGAALLGPLLAAGALLAAWESGFAFPETARNPLAALLVLGLGIWTLCLGPGAAGRCAVLLLWVTALLHGIVLLGSLSQLRLETLRPAGDAAGSLRVLAALLLPGAALCLSPALGEDQRLPHWPWWTAALLGAAAAAVTGSILSPALQPEPEAYRTLARGVSVLGVVRRFEALVNGAMLMNAYSLCALYLTAAASSLKLLKNGEKPEKN